MESLKVPIFKKSTQEVIYVAPGIKAAWLKNKPDEYADAEEVAEEPEPEEKPKRRGRRKKTETTNETETNE